MNVRDTTNDINGPSRFSPITDTDHAGYIWIITIVGTAYTVLSCMIRAWIKFRVYGWDDVLIAVATLLHLGQSISTYVALSYGLAKSNTITDPADGPAASKALFATQVLGLITLALSKCSVLALMMRVFTPETGITAGHRVCVGLTVASAAWGIASIIAISAGCGVGTVLTSGSKDRCPGLYNRLLATTIPDILTDVLICLVPPWVTMPLKMTSGVRFHVSLAFSFCLFVVPFSALALVRFHDAAASADPQLAVTPTLLSQQAALAVSLVSATIPNLRTFMKSFYSGSLNPEVHPSALRHEETRGFALRTFGGSTMVHGESSGSGGRSSHVASGNHTSSKSPALGRSRNGDGHGREEEEEEELALRPDGVHHQARISHGTHLSDATSEEQHSLNRCGSQERIITKRMEWAVRHDTG